MQRILHILILLAVGNSLMAQSQKERKVSYIGGARSLMTNNQMQVTDTSGVADTTTALRNQGGYALIDLGVRIMPNSQTEILGMFRIRNGFGGFWGSAVTFDVRQLYVKGIIAHAVRYQLGDINIKQTPFTLYNHHADAIDSLPAVFGMQNDIVRYEKFYTQNTWRMQGAHVDGGLTFKKYLRELNVDGFVTRMNATNFTSVPDRLMAGGSLEVIQSKQFAVRYTLNSVFDVLGTITDSNVFRNTIQSVDADYKTKVAGMPLTVSAEAGKSMYRYTQDTLSPQLEDYYLHAQAKLSVPRYHMHVGLGYLNVGPDYRSIGAQSKDIQYAAIPQYYDRYTNAQVQRPLTLMDVVSNDALYQRTVSSKLMMPNLVYNNAMPYGIATFNRAGLYGTLHYQKDLTFTATYYRLNEIVGQGTEALRRFSVLKSNVKLPLHTWLNSKKLLEVQCGVQWQGVTRKGLYAVDDVNFKSTQTQIGLRYEIVKQVELLGGWMYNRTQGSDFLAERNTYSEITYFTEQQYNLTQQVLAVGARYNFTPAIYLSLFYQQQQYRDANRQQANFSIRQFNILYNMLF